MMKDEHTRFAINLARSVNRLDFVDVIDELTLYELAAHQAASVVEPFGEDRADFRSAVNTARMIMSWVSMGTTEAADLIHALRCYLSIHQGEQQVAKPEQQRSIIQG